MTVSWLFPWVLPLGHLAAHVLPFLGTGKGTLQGEKELSTSSFCLGKGRSCFPRWVGRKSWSSHTLGLQGN